MRMLNKGGSMRDLSDRFFKELFLLFILIALISILYGIYFPTHDG
jgi:hypothetical protein